MASKYGCVEVCSVLISCGCLVYISYAFAYLDFSELKGVAYTKTQANVVRNIARATFPTDNLTVHFVRIYPYNTTPTSDKQLCFLDCLSLLSILKSLKPENIYLHTNVPSFWPFSTCLTIIPVLPEITVLPLVPTTEIGGKTVFALHHQADIAKLQVVEKYGGIAMDMDIFVLKGKFIRNILKKFDCMLIQEGKKMLNAGLTACRKGAKWPSIVLELYRKDYRTDWFYNSAVLPFDALRQSDCELQKTIYVDRTISDNPEGKHVGRMINQRGLVNWKKKVAFHAYYHRCDLGEQYVNTSETSFGDLLREILYGNASFI